MPRAISFGPYDVVTMVMTGVWRPPDANETTPYQAFITTKEGYRVVIGEFVTEEEAARAYDQEAKLLYKEKAMLNFGGKLIRTGVYVYSQPRSTRHISLQH